MPATINTKSLAIKTKDQPLLSPGHNACAGCGQLIAARTVLEAIGPDVIIANATGCLEVTTTPYPKSTWGVPWVHSLFENAAAVATGISAALNYQEKNNKSPIANRQSKIKVLAQGGDGGTFDIGFGLISGMWERGDNILYVCYDNEAYSNTGIQASGATPYAARTTTTPPSMEHGAVGSLQRKKDMVAIALAHGLRYVAQATTGNLLDISAKVKKALETPGPSYIQIMVPCIPGWGIGPDKAIKLGKMAAENGLYPVVEYIDGQLAKVQKIPAQKPTVEAYLKEQVRFSHLFKSESGPAEIAKIQAIADANIAKYGL